MRRNLAYQRIDKAIIQAFITLTETIPFGKLTVQHILDEALISRYTFYAHFPDKYAVAERIQDELYRDFLSIVEDSVPQIDAQKLSASQHHRLVDQAIGEFSAKNRAKLRSISAIQTETIDLAGKIRAYLSDSYLRSAAAGKNPRLEAAMYAAMAQTSMTHYALPPATPISQAVNDSYIRAMLYAVGIHDPQKAQTAADYLCRMARER